AEAVLGAEQRAETHPGRVCPFAHMAKIGVDRRGVADEPYRPATQKLAIEQDVGPEGNRHHVSRRRAWLARYAATIASPYELHMRCTSSGAPRAVTMSVRSTRTRARTRCHGQVCTRPP